MFGRLINRMCIKWCSDKTIGILTARLDVVCKHVKEHYDTYSDTEIDAFLMRAVDSLRLLSSGGGLVSELEWRMLSILTCDEYLALYLDSIADQPRLYVPIVVNKLTEALADRYDIV